MAELVVVTERDLRRQKLMTGVDVVAEIRNPTDALDPRLLERHEQPRLFEYDNVRVLSRLDHGYPNPTLNHYALAGHLKDIRATAPKVVDLGCGVGFLGNYCGANMEPEEVVFADLNQKAVVQSAQSWQLNHTDVDLLTAPQEPHAHGAKIQLPKGNAIDLRIGNAAETLQGYDAEGCIAVAAPMYVPGVCEVFPQAFHFFAQTAKEIGARLYIGHSNLSNDLVEAAAEATGLELHATSEAEVPFVIEYTDGRDEGLVLDDLVEKGLEIRGEGRLGHTLMVSKMVISELS